MKRNKKGIFFILGIVLVGILIFSFFAIRGFGLREGESLTPQAPSCSAPKLQVEVSGDFVVKDGSIIGIEPEIDRIDNVGIRTVQLALFEPFNYEVELIDRSSGVKLDSMKGSTSLPSDIKELDVPFNLFFQVPDNNCDGKIDSMRLSLRIQIEETQDIFKDTDVFEQDYTVKDGVLR